MRYSCRSVAALIVVGIGIPARAHIQTPHGRLLDLVRRSDVIVLGTAMEVKQLGVRDVETDVAVHDVLSGTLEGTTLTFRGPNGVAAGERYVIFLQRTGQGFASIQASGTIFPSRADDAADYRRVIQALRQALLGDGGAGIAPVRAALIGALSASAPPLRYHAALDLSALASDGHGPTESERQQLRMLLARPTFDPALRPLVHAIVDQR